MTSLKYRFLSQQCVPGAAPVCRYVAVLVAAASLLPVAVSAQDFPAKPIRIITGTAGGATDLASRVIAQGMSPQLGQPVIVENRGGGGIVAGPLLAKAPPDGYTLLVYGSTIWLTPLMRDNAPYDPSRDFAPISATVTGNGALVIHPSLPARTVKELIALARSRPSELNYAATGSGSANHLAAELFKSMARVNLTRINYKGTAPAVSDVLAGHVQIMFAPSVVAVPHSRSGKLRALAVTGAKRSELLPDLPTISASGVAGYESESRHGMFAPAKTPPAVIIRVHQEVVRVLRQSDSKQRLLGAGLEVVASTPEELTAMIRSELVKIGKVIREAGIREE